MKKFAQGGGDDGGNMMIEYWEKLREKRGKGLSEGEAVLEYLKENEQKQKKDTKRKAKANGQVWSRHFGRPV